MRLLRPTSLACLLAGGALLGLAAPARAVERVPGEVIVRMAPGAQETPRAAAEQTGTRVEDVDPAGGTARVLELAPGETVAAAIRRLNRRGDVLHAAPNLVARASAPFVPDDPAYERQWNFAPEWGVNAPAAWSAARAAGRPGARGVTIAVLDTGVAYRNVGRWRKSPDFAGTSFLNGYDFVSNDRTPIDLHGHGTHVAGTIAESTGNGIGAAGLAYRARILPVRVLDEYGEGDSVSIARAIRYAARRGAKLINASFEFGVDARASELPEVIAALEYARRRGALVIGASGNCEETVRFGMANHCRGHARIAYPARARSVLAVGATTSNGCRARYGNHGAGLDLVAPGGGEDAHLRGDPRCRGQRAGQSIYQMTFIRPPRTFGLPRDFEGTSMATPHVTGIAALALASGALPAGASPAAIARHLERTARDLGQEGWDEHYGHGLVDGAGATAR